MLSTAAIKMRALDLGFDLAGVSTLEVWKDLEFSRRWVENGFNGEMRYLENPKRFDPCLVMPSAKSVLSVGLIYNAPLPCSTEVKPGIGGSQESEVRSQNQEDRTQDRTAWLAPRAVANNGLWTTDNGQVAPRAWISRYAWGRDYHEIMRGKLEQLRAAVEELAPAVETRVYVDTGPVVERAFARFSGIGWMGKNTCIINQEKGSWFFLGVILTSLEFEADLPAPDRCGSCTACLEACPTGALVEPYVMDASRCISYLTIELRGSIPEEYRPKMGNNVFGCDICQDVCPWNGSRQPSVLSNQRPDSQRQDSFSYQLSAISRQQVLSHRLQVPVGRQVVRPPNTTIRQFYPMSVGVAQGEVEKEAAVMQQTSDHGRSTTNERQLTTDNGPRTTPAEGISLFNPSLEDLASISEEDFRRIFAHSPIKRAKYRGWLRNLSVAMGNSGDERFVPWLERAAQHPDPMVREHAAWALDRLRGK